VNVIDVRCCWPGGHDHVQVWPTTNAERPTAEVQRVPGPDSRAMRFASKEEAGPIALFLGRLHDVPFSIDKVVHMDGQPI
jgi:hypothetical protein